uniref:Uncharacterized protein n=1 Tax=Quercus lobata TaxID=97700 RepID=A0A7N2N7Q5_QUELO
MHDALESIINLRAWLVFVLLISILDNLKPAKGDGTEHARRRLVDQTPVDASATAKANAFDYITFNVKTEYSVNKTFHI